jgi:hypothetical protein
MYYIFKNCSDRIYKMDRIVLFSQFSDGIEKAQFAWRWKAAVASLLLPIPKIDARG